jgi:hypothetical protein
MDGDSERERDKQTRFRHVTNTHKDVTDFCLKEVIYKLGIGVSEAFAGSKTHLKLCSKTCPTGA